MNEKNSLSSRLSRSIIKYLNPIFLIIVISVCLISVLFTASDARVKVTDTLDNTLLLMGQTVQRVEASTKTISRYVQIDGFSDEDMMTLTGRVVGVDSCVISCAVAFNPEGPLGRHFIAFSYWSEEDSTVFSFDASDYIPNYEKLDWFEGPQAKGKAIWLDPDFNDEIKLPYRVASFANPIYENDRFVGVIRSDIPMDMVGDLVRRRVSDNGTVVYFVDRRGKYFVHPDASKINKTVRSSPMLGSQRVQNLLNPHLEAREKGNMGLLFTAGQPYMATYIPLMTGGMAVMFTPLRHVYRSSLWLFFVLVLMGLAGVKAIQMASRMLMTRFSLPITEFTYSAANMARGNFDVHIKDVDTDDEIRNLHDSLCYLQKSVKRYLQEFRESMASRQMLEGELVVARNIQMDMLPVDFPEMEEVHLHAMLSAAKEVGGDLYDFYRKDDKLYFCIGDVSGKGVPAALVMAQVKSSIRLLGSLDIMFSEFIGKLNDMVASKNNTEMFITFFIGVIYTKTGEFHYCNAGHNPLVLKEPGKPAAFLKARPNLALGVCTGFRYESEKMMLPPGTRILAYTDGVTEAETFDKRQFGEERLLQWMDRSGEMDPGEATASLFNEVREFAGGNPQNDDITIMAVHYGK